MRVLVAASGSGGHLFPALHIMNALRRLDPEGAVEFIGSGRPLEGTIIDPHGFRRHVFKTAGIKNRGLRGIFAFLSTAPKAVQEIRSLIRSFRPDVVVGVGGYASVLPVLLAALSGIPTWIHEAELKPGLANRLLAYFVKVISTAFERAEMPCPQKVRFTGHPVRPGLEAIRRANARIPLRRVFVTGGSQGAQALDRAMGPVSGALRDLNLEFWHQCRATEVAAVSATYQEHGATARVVSFVENMNEAYEWADLVISRSGASAVMELGVVNIPAILVPYPHAQGDHQTKNAAELVSCGKALLIPEGSGFEDALGQAIRKIASPATQHAMIEAPYESRSTSAAETIARGVLSLP